MKHMSNEEFSFQYYVDLGNNKLGHIFINQDSDPYVESSKFCVKYSLPTIIITILGDAIQEQIDQQKYQIYQNTRKQSSKKAQQTNFSLKMIDSDTLETELKEEFQEDQQAPTYSRNRSNSHILTHAAQNMKVFQNLYNNYKEIEMKKQIKRKKSLQTFTFKPQINHLSDRIVANKRKMTESSQKNILNIKLPLQLLHDERNINFDQPKISYRVTLANKASEKKEKTRENSQFQLHRRNEIYQKKSEEKKKKLRQSLQKKIMDNCSFKPKINSRMR